jgi:hypothetical protein
MIAFLTSLVGPRWAKPVFYVLLAVLAVVILSIGSCLFDKGAADQAKQTTKSSEALADAAEKSLETVVNANSRDASIDTLVTQTAEGIDNAPDAATARAVALGAVCRMPEYITDPACKVFKPDSSDVD